MEKNSFVFYYSYCDKLNWCTDSEFRHIILALIHYDKNGEIVSLTDREQIAFDMIKIDLEENRQKYKDKCEKNRQIAINRWIKEKEKKN